MHSRRSFLRRAGALAALPSLGTVACAGTAPVERPVAPVPSRDTASWLQVDWEREKVEKGVVTDTLVIHHTAIAPGLTWQDLSELQRKNLYVPRYTCECDDPVVKGQPPRSGHFRLEKGRIEEVFYAYHFFIRQDGTVEPLLRPEEVGWHAGHWGVNMRSLAICFDGDFSTGQPTEPAQRACAGLMRSLAEAHPIRYLMAHHEAWPGGTVCPGSWLMTPGPDGLTGRARLLALANLTLESLAL
jgi:hypothetical protein